MSAARAGAGAPLTRRRLLATAAAAAAAPALPPAAAAALLPAAAPPAFHIVDGWVLTSGDLAALGLDAG